MRLYEALDMFSDNIDEILVAMASNLRDDIAATSKEGEILGSSLVADEVRKLTKEYRHGDATRRLQQVVRYRNAKLQPATHGKITDSMIDRARQSPIEQMYVGKLRKSGGKLWGLCPFHNDKKHPAFIIDKNNKYHCFTCHAHGDAIDFYMKTTGSTFRKAITTLV